jgi:hypothetical protein
VINISGFTGWRGVKVVIPRTVEFIGDSCFQASLLPTLKAITVGNLRITDGVITGTHPT